MRFSTRFLKMNGNDDDLDEKENGIDTEPENEGVDLDFDMWYGQFEFVGPNVKDFKTKDFKSNGFKQFNVDVDGEENDEEVCITYIVFLWFCMYN